MIYVIDRRLSRGEIATILLQHHSHAHHDEDGHGRAKKPLALPWVADRFTEALAAVEDQLGGRILVDAQMVLYRLPGGVAVAHHRDEDFPGPDGRTATHSLLIPLNDSYAGGATVVEGNALCRPAPVGGALVFPHRALHCGMQVLWGEKLVLKTDVFTHLVPET